MDFLVRQAMTKDVVTSDADITVKEASKIMSSNRVGCLVITEKGSPAGMVTESDIMKKVVSAGLDAGSVKIREIMSKPLIWISPDDAIEDAANTMVGKNVRRLAVVEDEKLVGILTHTDIARNVPEMIDILNQRIRMRQPGMEYRLHGAGICSACHRYSEALRRVSGGYVCEKCVDEYKLKQRSIN